MKKTFLTGLFIAFGFLLFSQNNIGLFGNTGISVRHGQMYNSAHNQTRPIGPNLNFGMFYQKAITDCFSLGIKASLSGDFLFDKYSHTSFGGGINSYYNNINYLNFNIPLYFQFNVKKFSFDLGVQPALFLFTYSKYKDVVDGEEYSNSNIDFFNNQYNVFDIGIYSAISYKYNKTWSFEISYHNRLTSAINDLAPSYCYLASYSVGIKYFFGE